MKFLARTVLLVLLFGGTGFSAEPVTPKILLSDLKSFNSARREKALACIRATRPDALLPGLVETVLTGTRARHRRAAIMALKAYPGNDVIPQWLKILGKTGSAEIKAEVISFLSGINDRRVVVPFARHLSSPCLEVREKAAEALSRNGDDRMYPFIIELTADPNPVRRIYSLEALYYLYDRRFYSLLADLLRDENKSVRIYAVRCALQNNVSELLFIIRSIALNDMNDEARIAAINSIGRFRDGKSLFILMRSLNDENRNVRFSAASALNRLRMRKSIYSVSRRLYLEEDRQIQDMLINILTALGKTGDIRGFRKILVQGSDVPLQVRAAYALGLFRDERAPAILIDALGNSSYLVRGEVSNALGSYRTARVVDSLVRTVSSDRRRYVRSAALYSLARINSSRSVLPLYELYSREKDPVFRVLLQATIHDLIDRLL